MEVEVQRYGGDSVCLQVPLGDSQAYLSKSKAIQLAKDLLMACGAKVVADLPDPLTVQTAKEVLDMFDELKTATQIRGQTGVFSGMSLDEIQKKAGEFREDVILSRKNPYLAELAFLIANLAARVKELNLTVQSKKAIDAFKESKTYRKIQEQVYGPKPGDRIVCTCGQVHTYCRLVK